MSPHYLVKCTNFSFFSFFTHIEFLYTDELRKRLVATWAEFQQSMGTMQLISGEKDCKYVSEQKVVTLNICCNVRCLPDIPFATRHNRFFSKPPMPTHNRLFSAPPTFGGMQHTFSQMKFSQYLTHKNH